MSGDLQAYQTMKATTSWEKSKVDDAPYISTNDYAESERLQALAGGGLGSTLLDEESTELNDTLSEMGFFAQQEDVK